MYYNITPLMTTREEPVTINGVDYPSLAACPAWKDGTIARDALTLLKEHARQQDSFDDVHDDLELNGNKDTVGVYIALALMEIENDHALMDYLLTLTNDGQILPAVKFTLSSIQDNFPMANYLSFARKSDEMLDRFANIHQPETFPFTLQAIAFDDVRMIERLIQHADNPDGFFIRLFNRVAQFPYADTRVRNLLKSYAGDVRDIEITERLAVQKLIQGGKQRACRYSSISDHKPYSKADPYDPTALDLLVTHTPGFEQWLQESLANQQLLAASLTYQDTNLTAVRARALIPRYTEALNALFDSKMTVADIYLQGFMNHRPDTAKVIQAVWGSPERTHRTMVKHMAGLLRKSDPLSIHIVKTFAQRLGRNYVIDCIEAPDDMLAFATALRWKSAVAKLSPSQRDTLMGHDLGL